MTDQVDSTSTSSVASADSPGTLETSRRFLELIRFSHTVFALPFALLACVLAMTTPADRWRLLPSDLILRCTAVVLCMIFARSAAMSFNRLVDARYDAMNPRTAQRHIPAGNLSVRQVWFFFASTSVAFLVACLLFLPNWLPVVFALPVWAWICGYSLAKRFTSAAHLWLGVALALSPICAWIAVRGEVVIDNPADVFPPLLLAFAIAFWVTGFDIIYACQDAEFDREVGLQSIPAALGIGGALRVAAACHVAMLIVLAILPLACPGLSLGWLYGAGLLSVGVLVLRQHTLVSAQDLRRVGIAFFNINAVISLGLCLVTGIDAWIR